MGIINYNTRLLKTLNELPKEYFHISLAYDMKSIKKKSKSKILWIVKSIVTGLIVLLKYKITQSTIDFFD